MDKTGVIERIEQARASLDRLLVEVGETRMEQPGVEGDWSVKDILAHVMTYDRWTAAHLNAAREGRRATPREEFGLDATPPGAGTLDTDARNTALRDYYHDTPLVDVIAGAEHAFSLLMDAIGALSEEQLTDPAFLGWSDSLTTVQCIGIQTWEHYEAHEPALRAWVMRDEGLDPTLSS